MADIDVVPKRKTSAWLWILLALVIFAALFMLVLVGRGEASTTVQQVDGTIPPMSKVHASTLLLA